MTCRTCWLESLPEHERERVAQEPVTSCIYYCPEHQAEFDRMMSRVRFDLIQRRN